MCLAWLEIRLKTVVCSLWTQTNARCSKAGHELLLSRWDKDILALIGV
jgi:hypothetical protein